MKNLEYQVKFVLNLKVKEGQQKIINYFWEQITWLVMFLKKKSSSIM